MTHFPDKLFNDKPSPTTEPPAKRRPRKKRDPDPLWDAMVEVWPELGTTSHRSLANGCWRDLRELGAQPEELALAKEKYAKKHPDQTFLSAKAIIGNWSQCRPSMSEVMRRLFGEWLPTSPVWLRGFPDQAYSLWAYYVDKGNAWLLRPGDDGYRRGFLDAFRQSAKRSWQRCRRELMRPGFGREVAFDAACDRLCRELDGEPPNGEK